MSLERRGHRPAIACSVALVAWIRARLDASGPYTIANSRNGFSKTYQVK